MGLGAAPSDMERTPAGFDSAMEQSNQSVADSFKTGQPVDEFNTEQTAKMAAEDASAAGGSQAATGAVTAANPIAGGAILAGSMLIDNMMKANAQRKQMQLAQYQNQLSTISGGVSQYAQGARTVNQDMLQAMRGLA